MKIVINISVVLFLLFSLIYSCKESINSTIVDKDGCFIINGCDTTDFDLDRIFIRASYTINRSFIVYKSSIFKTDEIKDSINITTDIVRSICGAVKYVNSPVFASLSFIHRPADPLIPSTMTETDENGNFCAMLNEGDYIILVSPYKQETIPQLKTDIKINKDISNLNINYPTSDNVRYIYGNVILDTKSNLPVEGINVLAYKKYEDGVTLHSNISTTDSTGNFSLVIPTMSGDFSLMLYGSSKNPDWPIIKFVDIITEGIIQIGTINVGFVPQSKHITGMTTAQEKMQIIATMNSDEFNYSKNFYTDNDGYFETNLREGRYTFIIVPENIYSSKWGITSHSNISVPPTEDYKLTPEQKVKLEGRILFDNKNGTPRIRFIRSGGCEENLIDNIYLEKSIIPDSSGYFNVNISKGRYRILIDTEDNKMANMVSDSFCIDKDYNLKEIFLPLSCSLSGEIKNNSDIKLSNIRIEALLLDKKTNEYIKFGESTADSNQFSIKIPTYFCK